MVLCDIIKSNQRQQSQHWWDQLILTAAHYKYATMHYDRPNPNETTISFPYKNDADIGNTSYCTVKCSFSSIFMTAKYSSFHYILLKKNFHTFKSRNFFSSKFVHNCIFHQHILFFFVSDKFWAFMEIVVCTFQSTSLNNFTEQFWPEDQLHEKTETVNIQCEKQYRKEIRKTVRKRCDRKNTWTWPQ